MRWFIVALGFALLLASCGGSVATRPVTIDAHDPQSGLLIDPVNVWKDYTNRSAGVAGRTHDGAAVQLVQRVGDGVEVVLPDGTQGWVSVGFIKELR